MQSITQHLKKLVYWNLDANLVQNKDIILLSSFKSLKSLQINDLKTFQNL